MGWWLVEGRKIGRRPESERVGQMETIVLVAWIRCSCNNYIYFILRMFLWTFWEVASSSSLQFVNISIYHPVLIWFRLTLTKWDNVGSHIPPWYVGRPLPPPRTPCPHYYSCWNVAVMTTTTTLCWNYSHLTTTTTPCP